jgi:hypothetical protein
MHSFHIFNVFEFGLCLTIDIYYEDSWQFYFFWVADKILAYLMLNSGLNYTKYEIFSKANEF